VKIAQVAPLFESVPPKLYGGTERIVSYLTEELVRLGHDVTLFASGDSFTSARLEAITQTSLRCTRDYGDALAYQLLQLNRVAQVAENFDLIHYHVDFLHFPISRLLPTPQVTTLHGRLDLRSLKAIYKEFRDMPVVSISCDQRRPLGSLPNWVGNVYHGLPESFGLAPVKREGYLAFLGRISPEKRVDRAIEIAARANFPIQVAAKIDPNDARYFEKEISHLFKQEHVRFIGEIGESEKERFLKGARALLFPIDWPEPFGLVMIEAMACGTPVIAFNRGSVPEILEHGKTGYIVSSIEEAVEAVSRLDELSSAVIRSEFEKRFSVKRMASDYLDVFRSLVGEKSKGRGASLVPVAS
jgi:glycosyltransferase involved in cell wall biosynthesis